MSAVPAVASSHGVSPEAFLLHLFSSQSAREGGVIRRKAVDVERAIGREAFLAEMRRRGFRVFANAGQFIIICNREKVTRLA
ncbi:MAG TPA: N-(5'-phosphoribosyl)anthranilate isomerase [Paracoccaceae bacterium]|nr:N-(5'-phosphoribosyl)anthranilate isomerase [Paracoccaceae bacterium]HMO71372.1 N-(5'-phosphoribosyl)anthranilate isomerase [Paracoccaceae bacterium]